MFTIAPFVPVPNHSPCCGVAADEDEDSREIDLEGVVRLLHRKVKEFVQKL